MFLLDWKIAITWRRHLVRLLRFRATGNRASNCKIAAHLYRRPIGEAVRAQLPKWQPSVLNRSKPKAGLG